MKTMRERFDEYFEYMSGGYYASRIGRHAVHPDDIKHFIEQELKLKDQEHKAELDSIKGEIEKLKKLPVCNDERYFINIELSNAISILNNHINKLSTE